jgi:hypothetical protein
MIPMSHSQIGTHSCQISTTISPQNIGTCGQAETDELTEWGGGRWRNSAYSNRDFRGFRECREEDARTASCPWCFAHIPNVRKSEWAPETVACRYADWANPAPRIMYFGTVYKVLKTPGLQSASELYRPSDRRLSAKFVPTLAERGCRVVSATNPHSR